MSGRLGTLWKAEIDRAVALCAEGHGAIVFVTGPEGSGRTAFLHELATAFRGRRVVAGGIADGQYAPWEAERSAFARALGDLEKAIGLAATAVPVAGLIAQVITTSRAATDLVAPGAGPPESPALAQLADFLRAAAREEPTICIVDDSDAARGQWWSELLFGLAGEITRDLPLFLFLGIEDGVESNAQFAADELLASGAASRWGLPAVQPVDLTAIMGPADADVLEWLHDLAEGRVGWALELWSKWLGDGVVERPTDLAPWSFAPGQPSGSPSSILGVVRNRIERVLGDDLPARRDAWRMLACAALEGRYFIPEAVARALFLEADEVLAVLAQHPTLVEDAGPGRYRFTSPLVRTAMLRYGFDTPDERKRFNLKLAKGLERTYEGDIPLIAGRLSRLYSDAGKAAEADTYRALAGSEMPPSVVVEQARAMLEANTADWSWARCHHATATLLQAAERLFEIGPLDDLAAVAGLGAALARRTGVKADEGMALMLQGVAESYSGRHAAAESHLEAAIAVQRAAGDRHGEANALHQKAWLDGLAGHQQRALGGLNEELQIWRELQNPAGELNVHLLVCNLASRWDLTALRDEALQAAMALSEHASPSGWGHLLEELAAVALERNDAQAALAYYRRAAEHFEAFGLTRDAAAARRGVAMAHVTAGSDEEARPLLEVALTTAQDMENVVGEVEVRGALGRLERRAGNHAAAAAHFRLCIRLHRELGDERGAAAAEAELAQSPLSQA